MEKTKTPKLYEYWCKWGYRGSCSEYGDSGTYAFLTFVDEDTMKDRMREAANRLGMEYTHNNFLHEQIDGRGFNLVDQDGGLADLDGNGYWEITSINLDKISLEELLTNERLSEIIAEKQRIANEKLKTKEAEDKKIHKQRSLDALKTILREHPDLKEELL